MLPRALALMSLLFEEGCTRVSGHSHPVMPPGPAPHPRIGVRRGWGRRHLRQRVAARGSASRPTAGAALTRHWMPSAAPPPSQQPPPEIGRQGGRLARASGSLICASARLPPRSPAGAPGAPTGGGAGRACSGAGAGAACCQSTACANAGSSISRPSSVLRAFCSSCGRQAGVSRGGCCLQAGCLPVRGTVHATLDSCCGVSAQCPISLHYVQEKAVAHHLVAEALPFHPAALPYISRPYSHGRLPSKALTGRIPRALVTL